MSSESYEESWPKFDELAENLGIKLEEYQLDKGSVFRQMATRFYKGECNATERIYDFADTDIRLTDLQDAVFLRTIQALHRFVECVVLVEACHDTFHPILETLLSNGHVAESVKAYTDVVTLAIEYNKGYTTKLENNITQMNSLSFGSSSNGKQKAKGKKK